MSLGGEQCLAVQSPHGMSRLENTGSHTCMSTHPVPRCPRGPRESRDAFLGQEGTCELQGQAGCVIPSLPCPGPGRPSSKLKLV